MDALLVFWLAFFDEAVKNTVERIRTRPLRGVEAFLESRVGSKRLPLRVPLSEAKSETRWAMEKGFYAVLDVRQSWTADRAKDFETLDNKIQKARFAIEDLLRYLDPNARKGADLALALLTAQAGIQKNSDARALHDLARHDGECLWKVREGLEVLARLTSAAASKEVRVRRNRPPATKLENTAFATPLFEGWRLITGAEPGKNPTPEKNPFLVYVRTAWVDVFGQNENRDDDPQFIGALRSLSAEG
jgi:hypothetical protein